MKVSPDLKEVAWMEKTFLFKPGQLGSVAQSSLANLMIMVTMVGGLVHCLQCLVGWFLGWLPWLVHFSSELSSLQELSAQKQSWSEDLWSGMPSQLIQYNDNGHQDSFENQKKLQLLADKAQLAQQKRHMKVHKKCEEEHNCDICRGNFDKKRNL